MNLFSSEREKRLWLWALIVLMAIYSSLAFAGALVDQLTSLNMLAPAFFTGFIIVLLTIIIIALFEGAAWTSIVYYQALLAVVLIVVVRMGIPPVERTHLFEYGLLAFLLYKAFAERYAGYAPLRAAIIAVLITSALGTLDELIQYLLPNRIFDLRDIGFNILAATMSTLFVLAVDLVRHRGFLKKDKT